MLHLIFALNGCIWWIWTRKEQQQHQWFDHSVHCTITNAGWHHWVIWTQVIREVLKDSPHVIACYPFHCTYATTSHDMGETVLRADEATETMIAPCLYAEHRRVQYAYHLHEFVGSKTTVRLLAWWLLYEVVFHSCSVVGHIISSGVVPRCVSDRRQCEFDV